MALAPLEVPPRGANGPTHADAGRFQGLSQSNLRLAAQIGLYLALRPHNPVPVSWDMPRESGCWRLRQRVLPLLPRTDQRGGGAMGWTDLSHRVSRRRARWTTRSGGQRRVSTMQLRLLCFLRCQTERGIFYVTVSGFCFAVFLGGNEFAYFPGSPRNISTN